ncbi:MAG TPA: hypothetical protein VKB08_06870 [Bradyrhizobium sp.]|nr:hypothetical protein [Bradyrhizobium sp.]
MSEQAVTTTEAMMATVMKRRRRIIGVSPDEGKAGKGPQVRHNVSPSAYPEMPFSYQEMPVSYQKQRFPYHFLSR